jgi:hypothetical protein
MAAFTIDLTGLPLATREAIRTQLGNEDAAKMALAATRQAKIAQMYNQAVGPGTTKDGFGPLSMAVDPYWKAYFRRKHGDQCWADPEWVEWIKRKEEAFRVRETGTRIQVGYTAPVRNIRFSKKYDVQSCIPVASGP